MNLIGNTLESLKKQFPNKSPKYIVRNARRIIQKPPAQRTRKDRKCLFCFSIGIFEALMPDLVLDKIAKTIEPKMRKRLLTTRMLLLSLIVYNLSPDIESYSDIIRELTVRLKHRLPKNMYHIITKQSFSYQLLKRSPKIFRNILIYLLEMVVQNSSSTLQTPQGQYEVKAMDGSTFNLAPSLKEHFRPASNQLGVFKPQCKIHIVFDTIRKVVENFSLSNSPTNEKTKFKELLERFVHKTNIIWVCDLGYWAFWIMDLIMDKEQHFVFRFRNKTKHTVIKVLDAKREDYLVRLGSPSCPPSRRMKHVVRLIACPQEGSEIYYYVTSLLDPKKFSAQDIRNLYRARWSVEIFFRNLKHVLDFKAVSHSPNGIENEFYATLITYTLVRIVIHDAANEHQVAENDISFPEAYQTINSWIRQKHKIFSDAPIEKVAAEYKELLAFIAKNCRSGTARKRSTKKKRLRQAA